MPSLSIITINYNNALGLKRTIDSVINQTYTDLEYIVIDGGSVDESVEVIKEFGNKISFWLSEPDKGIYNAMNKGILKAEGEFLLFLNSGDCLIDEDVLELVFSQNQESFDIISGNLNQVFPNGKHKLARMPDFINAKYLYNRFLSHPSSFIKRSLFEKYGLYNENYKIAGDHAFFVKAFLTGSIKYHHIDVVITNYSMDGVSSNPMLEDLLQKERLMAFKEQLHPEYFRLIERHCKRSWIEYFLERVVNRIKSLFRIID